MHSRSVLCMIGHYNFYYVCMYVCMYMSVWMDQDATWYEGRPRPRPQCVT